MPNDTARSSPSSSEDEVARLQQAVADLQARVSALERGRMADRVARSASSESRFSLTALNRVGAVTLAVGIIFFFKYAADNQWIGEGSLVLLGMLIALLLIGFAEWLRQRSDDAFAQGVAGCGFAILYISIYASFGYYKLVPRGWGFAGLVAVSGGALAFSFRFASAAIAAVGVIGLWVAPLLVRSEQSAYLFVFSPASVYIAERLCRRIPRPSTLAVLPFNAGWALLTSAILLDTNYPLEFSSLAFVTAVVHFALAALNRAIQTLYAILYFVGHTCLLIGLLRVLAFWASLNVAAADRANFISTTASVFLALYGVVTLAFGMLGKSAIDRTLGLVLLGTVVVKLYLYDVWLLTRFYRITALIVLGVLLLIASYLYSRFKRRGDISR